MSAAQSGRRSCVAGKALTGRWRARQGSANSNHKREDLNESLFCTKCVSQLPLLKAALSVEPLIDGSFWDYWRRR
jgi:hypothetical protein